MTENPHALPPLVPILIQGDFLIASVQASLTDSDLVVLRDRISVMVAARRSTGVILDVGGLDVIDSFAVHTLQALARMVSLGGATTVIVGIQPDVAFAMVQWGLGLTPIATALDLDAGIEYLRARSSNRSLDGKRRTVA